MTAAPATRLRDVRVHRATAPARALAFARARLRRADRRVADPAPLGVTFLRVAPAPGTAARRSHVSHVGVALHLHLRPRLTVASCPPQGASEPPALPAARSVLRPRVVERGERLVERLSARGLRAETGPPGAPGANGAPGRLAVPTPAMVPPRAWQPPLRTVVVQRATAAPDGGAEPPAAPALPSAADLRAAAQPPLRAAAAAGGGGGLDLARVTDQVIAAIDRRIVVQRERLGRV
ncbi:MAG TPA: hypothetical protein VH834_07015 [Solirubrobacteraceae bacterium]|jgi:hypothetical protein